MIAKIVIDRIATFSKKIEVAPRRVNYIYGGNGSGKTSLSRLLKDPTQYPSSEITWERSPLETFVYNRDFVKENFEQDHLKGIFTLGKDVPETKKKIDEKRAILEKKLGEQESLDAALILKIGEHETAESEFQDECWPTKTKYAETFRQAMTGFVGTKVLFKSKCVSEQQSVAELKALEFLIARYKSLFETELSPIPEISQISVGNLAQLEIDPIFAEPIIGKTQSQIGLLIQKLQNSDWVGEGVTYLKRTENNECPFCQRVIDPVLSKEIEDFFDESYKNQSNILTNRTAAYIECLNSIIRQIEDLLSLKIDVYKFQDAATNLVLIRTIFEQNKVLLEKKSTQKSNSISLNSISVPLGSIVLEVTACIARIREHNLLIENLRSERALLIGQVWRFLASETKAIVDRNLAKIAKLASAVEVLRGKVTAILAEINSLRAEIALLESAITSVKHTVNEINRILRGFHFQGFSLAESTRPGFYQILRSDGTVARETLSEGEYTFISFLYFYHLIKGSVERTGISSKRVIVIDDPISSLDSNILFIVSNLVKSLVDECLGDYRKATIKQVFILTHNVYFHKEVTFKGQRENTTRHEAFWLVFKTEEVSEISTSSKNPINTTYSLLWDEIKSGQTANKVTVFNSLRRILEYYFKIIGEVHYEEIINQFEFEDKYTCKALISWINDGSHFVNDDLLIETEIESVDRYLKIFRDIFDKLGHISHYNMMIAKR